MAGAVVPSGAGPLPAAGASGRETPRRSDAVVVAAVLLLGAVDLVLGLQDPAPPSGRVVAVDAVIGGAAGLLLWDRRRRPVATALALAPLLAVSAVPGWAAFVGLGTVARRRPLPVAARVTAVLLAAEAVRLLLRPLPGEQLLPAIGTDALGLLIVVAVGHHVRVGGEELPPLRDRVVDVVLVTLTGVAVLGTLGDPVPSARFAVDAGVGALACLALLVRRRWPVATALALAAATPVAATASWAGVVALVTVAVHRDARRAAGVAAAFLAASVLQLLLADLTAEQFAVGSAVTAASVLALTTAGMYVRARRHLLASLRQRAVQVESEQRAREERARHLERTRIAREMHDVLAHRISLLSMHAGALQYRPDAPPADLARAAGVARATAHEALQDLREVLGVLRSGPDPDPRGRPQPVLADVGDLVAQSRDAGVAVDLHDRGTDLGAVPASTGRTAYRIVQEGLTNARKHAPGASVEVTVDGRPGRGVTVEVLSSRASGDARSELPGGGTGLVGLAERASLVGGRLESGPAPGGGFRVSAWLPWPA